MVRALEDDRSELEEELAEREAEKERASYIRNLYRGRRKGPSGRQVLLFLFLLVVLLIADGVYVGIQLRSALEETNAFLSEGADHFAEGELNKAEASFGAADQSASDARVLTQHPSIAIASNVPLLSADARAASALREAAGLSAQAGLQAVAAGRGLGGTTRERIADALYRDGQIQFETIEQGHARIEEAAELLAEAQRKLAAIGRPFVPQLRAALAEGRAAVAERNETATRVAGILDVFPRLFGRDEDRAYLLLFHSPAEATGSGGLIGLYGRLEAIDGRVNLAFVGPTYELDFPKKTQIDAPQAFLDRYGPTFSSFDAIADSPSFDVTAGAYLQMFQAATGEQLDGVMSFDPVALATLSGSTGPLDGGRFGPLTGDNAVDVLQRQIYTTIESEEDGQAQIRFLTTLIQDLWDTLGSGEADVARLSDGLVAAGRGQHFKFFSSDPSEQTVLDDLTVGASFQAEGPNVQFVYHNNLEGNKTDYFLERSIKSVVRLAENGDAEVTTTITLKNAAPPGPGSVLLGLPREGQRPGFNKMQLNAILPEEARIEEVEAVGGEPLAYAVTAESSFPAIRTTLDMAPGQERIVRISYIIPRAQTFTDEGRSFELVLFPQATISDDPYEVTVIPPEGFSATSELSSKAAAGGRRFTGKLSEPARIVLDLRPQR
jgi:hypothetical protein